MQKVYASVDRLTGRTPLVELSRTQERLGLKARVLAKLEGLNPAGSIKDRTAKAMIDTAETQGLLQPGAVIIEPTSGNTGIGLTTIAAVRGYRVILVMPDTMSQERRQLLRAYGAQLVLTPGDEGMQGAIAKAEAMNREIPGSWIPAQFDNPANPRVHYETTGPEIFEDTGGQADYFVAGVGTGGTITGTGEYLKEKLPHIKIAAVEPAGSPVLSGGAPGKHALQGIGAGFIPKVLNTKIYDEVIQVKDDDAFQTARALAQSEGLLVGISSGAAAWAAVSIAKRPESNGKTIVVILPDAGDRYLSTGVFGE